MAKSKSNPRVGTQSVQTPAPKIGDDERRRMISEAAYYRALTRGFSGGNAIDDWLAAEREINRLLPSPQQQKLELAAYQKLRSSVEKLLADAKDTLSADTIRQTLDDARTQLRQAGEYTADTVDKAIATVEREMLAATRRVGARFENLTERSADVFAVWRDRSAQFLAHAAAAAGEWVQQASGRLGTHTYRTGDIAAGGTLECTSCGGKVELTTAAHVPLCPQCRKSEFRRLA
jgi:hypothetical protein